MKIYQRGHQAFSLVEVVLALGIASFSMISIMGLLPVGLGNNRSSTAQTGAMNLITAIAADIRSTPPASSLSPRYSIVTDNATTQTFYFDEQGTIATRPQAISRYKALVQAVWRPSTNETVHRVTVSWPAQAASIASQSVEVVVPLAKN